MKKTASINDAIGQMKDSICNIETLHARLRSAVLDGNDAKAERFHNRINRAEDRYCAKVTAFAFLFDASFDELEHMALEGLGYGHLKNARELWEHALVHGA